MESTLRPLTSHLKRLLREAVVRMQPSVSLVSCIGILLAYLLGVYVTGSLHQGARWLGAMLACTSVVVVLQSTSYRESLRMGWLRVLGTFLGALIAYAYLSVLPFSIVGMLLSVFVLEMLSMLLGIYKNDRIATITLLIILLVSQMTPHIPPLENCLLRFFESAVGVGIGVGLVWLLECWRRWRLAPQEAAAEADAAGTADAESDLATTGVGTATAGTATAVALSTDARATNAGRADMGIADAGTVSGSASGTTTSDRVPVPTGTVPAGRDASGAQAAAGEIRGTGPAGHNPAVLVSAGRELIDRNLSDLEFRGHKPAGFEPASYKPASFGPGATGPFAAGPSGHSPADPGSAIQASAGRGPGGQTRSGTEPAATGPADPGRTVPVPAGPGTSSPKTFDTDTMPLRWGHFRVLIVASLGQITGAGLATLVGVILPMIQLVRHPALTSFQQGAVASTSLAGIMIGSLAIGAWSDRRGYLFFFRACPVLILAASLAAFFADRLGVLVPALLLMGIGIGGGYSLDSDYISEIMPRRWRLTMVGAAKAASSLGNIAVAGLCFYLLQQWRDPHLWNRLLLLVAALALVMVLARIRFAQSPGWLIARGRIAEAERAFRYFLGPDVVVGEIRRRPSREQTRQVSWGSLFRRGNIRKVIFSGIPWACEGVGVYGIGVFLPVLILALGLEPASESPYSHIVRSVELTAWINCFILPGFVLGLLLVNRWYHVRTQTWGFVLCTAGLALLYAAWRFHLPVWVAVAGFMAFELFLNAGPHLMTFILPPQIYSVTERGAGTGLAAAFGKAGAVVGVLFIPLLLGWGGAGLVLLVCMGVLLLGGAVTAFYGREVLPDRGRAYRPEIRHAEPASEE